MKLALIVVQENKLVAEHLLSGKSQSIVVKSGQNFVLIDRDTGRAPQNLMVERKGNKLIIRSGTGAKSSILLSLEDFYAEDGTSPLVIGVAEDGNFYHYVSADAQPNEMLAQLSGDITSQVALGGNSLGEAVPDQDDRNTTFPWLIAALAGTMGLFAIAGSRNSGDNSLPTPTQKPIPPDAPAFTVIDDVSDVPGTPGIPAEVPPGGTTNDNKPTFTGSGTAGDKITIIVDEVVIGTTTVNPDGTWSFTPVTPLPDGPHSITTTETDPAGNTSAPSASYPIIVDTKVPLIIKSAYDDYNSTGDIFDGGATDDSAPLLKGVGEPGKTVHLLVDGIEIGSGIVDALGNWEIALDAHPLSVGQYELVAVITNEDGSVAVTSRPFVIEITSEREAAVADPTLEGIRDNVGNIDGSSTFVYPQDSTNDNQPTLNGSGGPGDTIVILDGDVEIARVIVGDDGVWSIELPNKLEDGLHNFSIYAEYASGGLSVRTDIYPIIVDTAIATPVLGLLSDSGADNADGITNVSTVNVDGLETTAGASWEYQVDGGAWVKGSGTTFELEKGTHDYVVRQTDAAGNTEVSEKTSYTLDANNSTPPLAELALLVDTGISTADGVTNVSQVNIVGLPEGSDWEYRIDNGPWIYCDALLSARGRPDYVPSFDLLLGQHVYEVRAVDRVGNVGDGSAATFSYDPISPIALLESSEFAINTFQTGSQTAPSVTSLVGGGYVVAWQVNDPNQVNSGIYIQAYSATGLPMGGPRLVSVFNGIQNFPTVASLADGGFIVAWESYEQGGDLYDIYYRQFDASGAAMTDELLVNSTVYSEQSYVTAAGLANGGFVISWQSYYQDGSGTGIYAQQYDTQGKVTAPEFLVNAVTESFQSLPQICSLRDGGYVIVWQSYGSDGSDYGIYAQRFDGAGAPVGGEFCANSYVDGTQYDPTVASLADGGFVILWASFGQDGSSYGVYGQCYGADGLKSGAEFLANATNLDSQRAPSVYGLNDGGFVVVWQAYGQDGNLNGVYGRVFGSAGEPRGDEFQVNRVRVDGSQENPDVIGLSGGGFLVVWQDTSPGASLIYSKAYDQAGRSMVFGISDSGEAVSLFGDQLKPSGNSDYGFEDNSGRIASLRITFASGYIAGEDVLEFKGLSLADISATYGLQASRNNASGEVLISGVANVEVYRTLLNGLMYENLLHGRATVGDRVLTFDLLDIAGNKLHQPAELSIRVAFPDEAPPIMPESLLRISLLEDTGASQRDGITNNPVVNVSGLEAGATWQYQIDNGAWTTGTGT
uniref:Ig-like domain-containing protein n=1 Tax=Polynucleobacter sp. TaxID=2029855 RepID=UPI0037C894E8